MYHLFQTPAAKAAPAPPAPPATPTPPIAPPPAPTLGTPKPATGDRVFISPLARRLAAEQGIDITQLSGLGTGIRGMVRAADLANARPSAAAVSAATAIAGSFVDIPTSGLRAVIASRLTESNQTIPHYYLTTDIIMDDVLELRQDVNAKLAKRAVKAEDAVEVTVNDIIVKAVAATCRKVPECNSSWQGDFIRQFNTVDVNVAIATSQGLLTPIIYGADSKGLVEINQEVRALAAKAKENKLQLHEFQGGTFTVSNLGMFGISSFCAIINPPQACLLAVGNTQQQIFPDENTSSGFRKRQVMSVTLCCDHRVVDGAVGAQWLAEFKSLLENPALMLV
ncbi:pyruvate dehydrogenase E2 component (dihydrolipoamide acetyltransferase) [Clonorchis sinensis]|uniref:Pyruvate dehydrogenase E2 component (Dihydrolipoamide acetyltransferase) n=1 Tax=Clonorchis sinensis TaxID=79923 RepID=G7YF11_CLOSI|nr:pyruvate dehydrogenase E2 component (dihydrolipoamide acetyltransferase) [Clonorchis sinensis]